MLDYQDILGSKGFQEKEDPLDSEVSGLTGGGAVTLQPPRVSATPFSVALVRSPQCACGTMQAGSVFTQCQHRPWPGDNDPQTLCSRSSAGRFLFTPVAGVQIGKDVSQKLLA